MQTRCKIIVKGLVQEVGYRYFCYQKALLYKLTGYAKNLSNRNVEIEIQGESNLIEDFIKEIRIGPVGAQVNSISTLQIPLVNQETGFRIY